ncbi:MAG: hypothetical protein HZA24_06955 [Nitrospirae bacterium]|nr:hypothetical protein [Nitrospirota bacterium]
MSAVRGMGISGAGDRRPAVVAGSAGHRPGPVAADFMAVDTLAGFSDHLAGGATPVVVVVRYVTMWCPIRPSHSAPLPTAGVPACAGRGTVACARVDDLSAGAGR